MTMYILDENENPIKVSYEEAKISPWRDKRRNLIRTYYREYFISTVFLVIDHNFGFGDGAPVLWETMVFQEGGGEIDSFTERYSSRKDALKGHQRIVNMIIDAEKMKNE